MNCQAGTYSSAEGCAKCMEDCNYIPIEACLLISVLTFLFLRKALPALQRAALVMPGRTPQLLVSILLISSP